MVRKAYEEAQGRGAKIIDWDEREWLLSLLLIADDTLASTEQLQCLVTDLFVVIVDLHPRNWLDTAIA